MVSCRFFSKGNADPSRKYPGKIIFSSRCEAAETPIAIVRILFRFPDGPFIEIGIEIAIEHCR